MEPPNDLFEAAKRSIWVGLTASKFSRGKGRGARSKEQGARSKGQGARGKRNVGNTVSGKMTTIIKIRNK